MIRHVSKVALCAAAVFFLSHTASADAACRNFLGSYTASKHWLASAEKGDPLAQANVGDMYRRGDGVDKDFAKAYDWLKKSVAQGCEQGEFALGNLLFDMWFQTAKREDERGATYSQEISEYLSESVKWKHKAAEKSLPDAQYSLAIQLEVGLGSEKNEEAAFSWYQKAADQGHPGARWQLGLMYRDGRTVPQNLVECYFLLSTGLPPDNSSFEAERDKVRQQMTDSQVRIAKARISAWFDKEEFEIVKAQAELDWPSASPDAQLALAWKYRKGDGTPKDNALALKWFMKAAEQGNAEAQLGVGVLLWEGKGVAKDSRAAFDWFKKSAMLGNALAQYFLGMMYARGEGTSKDYQLGAHWYSKAAQQGNALAQAGLAGSYAAGHGVPKDMQSAYFWLLLAAANGGDDNVADIRDRIESSLTPDERAKAQAAARNWKPGEANSTPSPTDAPIASNTKPKATGSGFFVSRNHVVTNFHVIDGCARIAISGRGAARIQSSDARNDLALLELKAGNDSTATLRDGRLRAGEPITVIGYPLAGLLAQGANVTTGNVSALAGPRNDVRLVQITAPVQSGNSGGPLIDASGNVAGVVVSKLDTLKLAKATGEITQNVNFAINGTMLQAFLDSSGTQYRTAPLGRKLSAPDIAERAKQFTGLVECY